MTFVHRSALLLAAAVLSTLGAAAIAGDASYFSVAQIDGVWWFVNPQGHPFYSIGVSDIGPGSPRDAYDSRRPAYAAFRHYDSTDSWADDTVKRLTAWHFNTLGSWVHSSLTRGSLPYAEVLHLGAHVGVPWNDLFSEEFPREMNSLAQTLVVPRSDDHNLIGWFTDNELSWYPDTLFRFHLAQPPTSATRAKLLDILGAHYKQDFALLQRDFQATDASSFDDLRKGGKLELRQGGEGRQLIQQFAAIVAERYYRVTHDAIRRYDANHLILGDRYPWLCPKAVAEAAGPYVDVISTNFDWPDASDGYLPCGYLRNLHTWTGRPVLVTECYVAANENRSGNKNTGGVFLTVATQDERVEASMNRLRILAEQPCVIGAHWFRFADEPPQGRLGDGEDYNFGLVDIDNRPYESLVQALTRLNTDIPELHRISKQAIRSAKEPIRIPQIKSQTSDLHSQLLQTQSFGPIGESLGVYEVTTAWSPEKLYIAALACPVSEGAGDPSKAPANDGELELIVALAGMEAPVRIRLGGSGVTSPSGDQADCWAAANGLRNTVVVALPAARLGRTVFKKDDTLELELSFRDLRDDQSASERKACVLVAELERPIGLVPAREGVERAAVSQLPATSRD